MRTIKNQSGFVAYVPLAVCCLFTLYVLGALAWSKVETWARHRELIAEHRAAQEAKIEERRIAKDQALAENQMEAIREAYADQAENTRRLIEEQARTADKITVAYRDAAGEVATAHREASGRLATMAENIMAMKTDRTLVFILAGIALAAVGGLVFVVIALIRRGGPAGGPVIVRMEGGTPGHEQIGWTWDCREQEPKRVQLLEGGKR